MIMKMIRKLHESLSDKEQLTSVNSFALLRDVAKQTYGIRTQTEIARFFHLHQPQVANFSAKNSAGKRVILNAIKILLSQSNKQFLSKFITPIFELKRITPVKRGTQYKLRPNAENADELKEPLRHKFGCYIFFDSFGRPFYVGKANRMELYNEITQRLKRKVEYYNHDLRKVKAEQGEFVAFLSAYEINPKSFIDKIEALLIRSFANVITNKRIESIV